MPAEARESQEEQGGGCFRRWLNDWLLVYRQTPQLLKLLWRAQPALSASVLLITVPRSFLPAFELYCMKRVIDGATIWLEGDAQNGSRLVLLFLGLWLGSNVVFGGLGRLILFLTDLLERQLRYHLQDRILGQTQILDMTFFETPSFYDKLRRAEQEVGYRPFAIVFSAMDVIREGVTISGYLVVLSTLAWWSCPYLFLLAIPAFVVQTRYGKAWWRLRRDRTSQQRRMSYYQDVLTSNSEAKEIRLFALGDYFRSGWRALFWQFYRQDRGLFGRQRFAEFSAHVLYACGTVAFYGYALYRTITDPFVTIGSFVMYGEAMDRAVGSVYGILDALGRLYENNLYLSNLLEYLAQEPRISSPADPVPVPVRTAVRFESVCFRYPGMDRNAVEDISFQIEPGEKVALVGENGAGKTSVIKLLARLYDPQEGRITVDGVDLRDFDPADWQRQIGIIFQDFALYAVTARENVGFGQLEYVHDLARIRASADLSGATEPIERLKDGWEAILGKAFDEGQELSLGEWQKVALARAFLREATVLVLDEPTASLDASQEYEIFKRFNELAEGKTTILISHRFSTVRMADRVLVLERGRIIESGTHAELIRSEGKYAELFTKQATAYRG